MTVNKTSEMRHIPEEELHAYLDQALSRSQCVEIESHLASCPGCRRDRDEIAALRDRTTALLAGLAPRRVAPPPVNEIRARAVRRVRGRRRAIRGAAWAASVLVALGFGWTANSWIAEASRGGEGSTRGAGGVDTPIAFETEAPVPVPLLDRSPSPSPSPSGVADGEGASLAGRPLARSPVPTPEDSPRPVTEAAGAAGGELAAGAVPRADTGDRIPEAIGGIPAEPLRVEITPALLSGTELLSDGLWRSVSWDGAQAESNGWVPRVEGLPVVEVQLQRDEEGTGKPLMVVAQRLRSGQMIRTVEGPIARVSDLLSRQSGPTVTASVQVSDTTGTQTDERMLAIYGSLPVDSLRAFLLKVR